MKKRYLVLAALLGLLTPVDSVAQVLSVTARAGVFAPVGDYDEAQASADELLREREGNFAFGASINLKPPLSPFGVRFVTDYVTGSTLSRDGVTNGPEDNADAKTLYTGGDVLLTPIPRLLILQPFVAVGAGYRHTSFDNQNLPDFTEGDLVGHVGLGFDVGLGGLGLVAELSDYIARGIEGGPDWEHDLFLTAGIKIPLL